MVTWIWFDHICLICVGVCVLDRILIDMCVYPEMYTIHDVLMLENFVGITE